MEFVHLHTHTEYSLLDGATRIDNIFKKCYSLGQNAVAITDHGNMFGVFEFFKQAVAFTDKKADPFEFSKNNREFLVKPIIGCEVYVTDNHTIKTIESGRKKSNHLILLCKNKTGYHNLVKLVSRSYKEGFYYKPRVDFELISLYSEGLICLSACLSGQVASLLKDEQYGEAMQIAKQYKALFKDDYYIEMQNHELPDQKKINPHLINIAKQLNIKLVATNDCHYLEKSDSEMQRVLQCVSYRTTLGDRSSDSDDYFPNDEFYIKSADEMSLVFQEYGKDGLQAILNTQEIANKCQCDYFVKEQLLPSFVPPNDIAPHIYLRELAFNGLAKKLKVDIANLPKHRIDRLEYELDIITRLGFVEYFLIVWDFIHYAEQNNIAVGPGRGSGVGSLVAYSIGITKVDPQKYDLYFERFLNSERVSNPDFDIDFCVVNRDKVIEYVVNKYGDSNVAQIVTFGTLAAKAAIKDCGRVYNVPYADVDKITKAMPKVVKKHIKDLLTKPELDKESEYCKEFEEMYSNDLQTKKIVDMAIKIEGLPRQTGIHAAGVVICRDNIDLHVPIMKTQDDKNATQFDMIECEQLGLLKMDFLGLNTLTDISGALQLIKDNTGKTIDFYNMEYDDKTVFKMIGDGDTHGVFQLESGGMKSFLQQLKPTCLEDIIAGISLYRPGPMDKIPDYVKGKKDGKNVKYAHPLLQPILNVTYGVIVYQEQVMQIVRELGGYTLGRADIVRRLMSKKKADEMLKEKEIFLNGTPDGIIKGAIKIGVDRAVADKLFEDMTSFASYAFNKSHAAAYAFLSYQTAYLKRHYPKEFFASMLNNRITHIEEIANYLTYIKEKNIKIYPPSVNKSKTVFTVEKDGLRVGMGALKNVGLGFIEELVNEREKNGPFKNFEDYICRLNNGALNKKNLESMIYAGCFDEFNINRRTLMLNFDKIVTINASLAESRAVGQFSLFDTAPELKQEYKYTHYDEYDLLNKLQYEKQVAGVYLSGHPLQKYSHLISQYKYNSSCFIKKANHDTDDENNHFEDNILVDNQVECFGGFLSVAEKKITRKGQEMGIGRLEDMHGSMEIMVSPYKFEQLKHLFIEGAVVEAKLKVSDRDGEYTLWVEDIKNLDDDNGVQYDNNNGNNNMSKQSIQPNIQYEMQVKNSTNPIMDSVNNLKKVYFYCSFNTHIQERQSVEALYEAYQGDDIAFIRDLDTNTTYKYEHGVNICNALILELNGVLGKNHVKTQGM